MTRSILLHVCCGPCASAVTPCVFDAYEDLGRGRGSQLALYFYNPNIHPYEEYLERLNSAKIVAAACDVELIEADYDPRLWDETMDHFAGVFPLIKGAADYEKNLAARMQRCTACYRLRFEKTAQFAHEEGFAAVGTTLSISPHQFTTRMQEVMDTACGTWRLTSAFQDFRHLFSASVQRSKELDLYRQKYCGCKYSLSEAEIERAHNAKVRHMANNVGVQRPVQEEDRSSMQGTDHLRVQKVDERKAPDHSSVQGEDHS